MEEKLDKLIKVLAIQTEIETMRAMNEANLMGAKAYYSKSTFYEKVLELKELTKE